MDYHGFPFVSIGFPLGCEKPKFLLEIVIASWYIILYIVYCVLLTFNVDTCRTSVGNIQSRLVCAITVPMYYW